MVLATRRTPLQAIRKATQQQARYPAPMAGLNYARNILSEDPQDALVLDNLIPRPFGVEIRKGWKFWVPEANKFSHEVRSLMVFNSKTPGGSRLFASIAEPQGRVYNVTTPNAAPTLSLTPSTLPVTPGEWYYTNYTTPGGNFLCMVSRGAGYYVYNSSTGWQEFVAGSGAGKIEFPAGDTTTTKDFVFCWTWKNRLWFLKSDSSTAYYLPVSSISGKVTAFDLGPQLVHGGAMNFATSWTYDSGAGLDDGLVFVSLEGDVLIYQGTDPSSAANFQLKGSWYVGRSPVGRRCFTQLGGDVLILTEYGIIKVSDMVSGRIQPSSMQDNTLVKINIRLARLITNEVGLYYWFLMPYPSEELLIVGSPYYNPNTNIRQSFIQNSVIGSWATISEMDLLCAENFQGLFVFGTRTGNVCQGFVGYHDGTSSDNTVLGSEVTGRLQTSFLDLLDNTKNKRLLRAKLYGLANGIPSYSIQFVEEYKLDTYLSTPAPITQAVPAWDSALWDNVVWNANSGSFKRWIGVSGFGKKLSMLLAIRGSGYTLLSDYEILFETGINL